MISQHAAQRDMMPCLVLQQKQGGRVNRSDAMSRGFERLNGFRLAKAGNRLTDVNDALSITSVKPGQTAEASLVANLHSRALEQEWRGCKSEHAAMRSRAAPTGRM